MRTNSLEPHYRGSAARMTFGGLIPPDPEPTHPEALPLYNATPCHTMEHTILGASPQHVSMPHNLLRTTPPESTIWPRCARTFTTRTPRCTPSGKPLVLSSALVAATLAVHPRFVTGVSNALNVASFASRKASMPFPGSCHGLRYGSPAACQAQKEISRSGPINIGLGVLAHFAISLSKVFFPDSSISCCMCKRMIPCEVQSGRP